MSLDNELHEHGPVPSYILTLEESGDRREHIACPLCSSTCEVAIYEGIALRGNNLRLAMCLDCSHMFINPRPSMDVFKEFYADESYFHLCADHFEVSLDEKMAQFGQEAFWGERFVHGKLLYDKYLTGVLSEQDVVFDFGCGDGAWLWALREITHCDVDGEEVSPIYAEVVKEHLGKEIFVGPVEEVADDIIDKYRGRAKLAIVSGSLQHMLDPVKCLRAAREILTPDGLLYVCNWSIFDHYMASYPGERRRMVGEILSWEHLHYFHELSFKFMLAQAGFEVVDFSAESEIRPRHMDAIAKKTDGLAKFPSRDEVLAVGLRVRAFESATILGRLSRG